MTFTCLPKDYFERMIDEHEIFTSENQRYRVKTITIKFLEEILK